MLTLRTLDNAQIRMLYEQRMRRDFPPSELKHLSAILSMCEKGVYDVLGAYREEHLAAYALMYRDEAARVVLLDYLAVDEPLRGQGIGTAAFALAADYCFDVMGLSEVYAGCYEGNVRSRKMLAACGFVPHPEGNCEEVHFRTGEPIIQYDYIKTK